jgi:hypothetical protein
MVDTSGSMLLVAAGVPTFGDGSSITRVDTRTG